MMRMIVFLFSFLSLSCSSSDVFESCEYSYLDGKIYSDCLGVSHTFLDNAIQFDVRFDEPFLIDRFGEFDGRPFDYIVVDPATGEETDVMGDEFFILVMRDEEVQLEDGFTIRFTRQ